MVQIRRLMVAGVGFARTQFGTGYTIMIDFYYITTTFGLFGASTNAPLTRMPEPKCVLINNKSLKFKSTTRLSNGKQKEKHPSKDECFLFGCGSGHFLLPFCNAKHKKQTNGCKKSSVTAKNMRSSAYFFNATSNPTLQTFVNE